MSASASVLPASRAPRLLGRVDLQAVAVWTLGYVLVVYLGIEGGGFDPIVRDQLGIVVWWTVLIGLAVGALPLSRTRRDSWIALGLLLAYGVWLGLSAAWSLTPEGAFEDLGRVMTLLGVLALGIAIRGPHGARRMIGALAAAIATISVIALLGRFHPGWFSGAQEAKVLLPEVKNRLSYPLGYWNGLAALVAIGIPLTLYVASSGKHVIARALGTAALPALVLSVYLTVSRGGTIAAVVGIILFFALAEDRIAKAVSALIGALGGAALIFAASQRGAFHAGVETAQAHDQGSEMLVITIVVCAIAGLLAIALSFSAKSVARPTWTRPSSRASLAALSVLGIVMVVGLALFIGSGKASSTWVEFKESGTPTQDASRFGSASSNGRWPFWTVAFDEFKAAPIVGKGSGSFEVWWAQNRGAKGGFARDAHSLYLESLAELGIVGFTLILAFLTWVFVSGGRRYLGAARSRRTQLGAILAGCGSFAVAAAYDWVWELAIIPIVFLLLISVLITAGDGQRRGSLPILARLASCAVAAMALIAIGIPLSSATSLSASRNEVRQGSLSVALGHAADAEAVEPFAAGPKLQSALILEQQGRISEAELKAQEATEKEAQDWRAWAILSRLQAERGKAKASVRSYRRARRLNPRSPLFN